MTNAPRFLIRLDSRWDECIVPEPGYTAWPNNGFISSIVTNPDVPPEAFWAAAVLATYAAEGARDLSSDTVMVTGTADRQVQFVAGLRFLANHGFIDLVGGEGW